MPLTVALGGWTMGIGRVALVGAASLLLMGGGAAGAAFAAGSGPVDGSGVIHGCWTNAQVGGSHVFVLQDAGSGCPKGTTAISWNQSGPQGATGPQGAQGVPGVQGPQGVPGAQGAQGVQGQPGVSGSAGADGSTILSGAGAPSSSTGGSPGDFYIDTAADVLYGPLTSAGWSSVGTSLVGPAGPAGSFGGVLSSPDGQFSLSLTDSGIVLGGPGGSVSIDGSSVKVVSAGDLSVQAAGNVQAKGGAAVSVQSGSGLSLKAGTGVQISGISVGLNGGCVPVARLGDSVVSGSIVTGSSTVSSC